MNAIHSTKNKHSEFIITTKSGISTDGISTLQSLFQDILDDLGIPKKSLYLKKGEDSVINALYICILDMLRDKLVAEDFKYTTRFEFMIAYENVFKDESDKEKELLWQTANWMCILFKMVRANANLGLAIEVVSKLLEGWNGKIWNLNHNVHLVILTYITFDIIYNNSEVHHWRRNEACNG